jgi:NYN domain
MRRKSRRLLLFRRYALMRVYAYVDGFNLYYRALQKGPHKWLNLGELVRRLLSSTDTVEHIRYFTARVSARAGQPSAPARQQIYLNALGTLPNVEIHFGTFLTKTKKRPLVTNPAQFVEVHDTEEKGSDVNLAVHLVNDGWHGRYDAALVLSQDTDLIEPMRIVRTDLRKPVGLVWLDGKRPSKHLAGVASFVRHVSRADLAAAQFPNPIARFDGALITKPAGW